jgi:soluble lytic murein transglycosylase-like protein
MIKIKPGVLVILIIVIIVLTVLNIAVLSTLRDVNNRMIELEILINDHNERTSAVMTVQNSIMQYIKQINPAVSGRQAAAIATAITVSATNNHIDPYLFTSLARIESSFITAAVSRANAQGLVQIRPKTFRSVHPGDINNIQDNIEAGARYLRHLLDRFDGDLRLALAAYNCGPSRSKDQILKISGQYADRVLNNWQLFNTKGA